MAKTMLVNVTHAEESRVAILENGVLADYEIETINRASFKGNIHNAVVDNVIPSLEAAFVKLGSDLKGFLPLDEVNFKLLPARGESRSRGKIGQHLHPGQRLMVQVVREPFAGKPPTVSTYFSLPGRYLVLMPGVDSAGISRKIEDGSQRERLKKIVEELRPPEGFGLIVRTAGLGQTKTELQRDLRYLLRLWESVQRASKATDFPGLVYRERDLVIRTIRDHFTPDIDEVWIDSPETYELASEFVRDVIPTRAKALKLYQDDRPLFNKFNLEEQIESIYKRRVPLPSGGEIVIDGTEALTAVDVNSARSSRQGEAEDNAVQTNLEAAGEIGRQLRLRDLGGLLVIDFIDMMKTSNQKKVEKAMRDAMKGDRARYDVTRISKLGLLEIARQRIKGEKMGASYATCPACEGYGLIKNVESAALSALRKLQARCTRGDFGKMRVALPIEVANWILNNKREDLVQIERRHSIRVQVEGKGSLRRHESEFETSVREKVEAPPALSAPNRPLPPLPPDMHEFRDLHEEEEEVAAADPGKVDRPIDPAAEPSDNAGRKRRRRRRRGGRGRNGADVQDQAAPAVAGARTSAPPGEGPPMDTPDRPRGPASLEAPHDAVHPREPDPTPALPPAEAGAQDPGDPAGFDADANREEGTEPRKRRRRRRRRRGRGQGGGIGSDASGAPAPEMDPGGSPPGPAAAAAPAPSSDEGAPRGRRRRVPVEHEETMVPPHVSAEELMPAAVGSRSWDRAGGGVKARTRARGRRRTPETDAGKVPADEG